MAELADAADWQRLLAGLAYLKMAARFDGKVTVIAHGERYAEVTQRDDETVGQAVQRCVAAARGQ